VNCKVLDQITPLILTYNEAPNIGRTLERLDWAGDIVIVDSFSSDSTLEIISRFSQARVCQRQFDTHGNQWSFGLKETGIKSEWVLALDADYLLTAELIEELKSLEPESDVQGYRARFVYCINGQQLRGSAYPPVTVLYRRANARYVQDGHTQRVEVEGEVRDLQSPILHDDRKPLSHWIRAQSRYMRLEAEKISRSDFRQLGWADRLRKGRVFAPFVMFFYCMLIKGVVLNGRVGFYYSLQRTFSEFLLSLYLIENDLNVRQQQRNFERVGLDVRVSNAAASTQVISVADPPATAGGTDSHSI
jgi:glycosyltransferase involved in cell wall biosynthesis